MKLELRKIEGRVIGYNLLPETPEEEQGLAALRDIYFFGLDGSRMCYDGYDTTPDEKQIVKISFITREYNADNIEDIERMVALRKTITLHPCEAKPVHRYKCIVCDSHDVELAGWINPNDSDRYTEPFDEDGAGSLYGRCHNCSRNGNHLLIKI